MGTLSKKLKPDFARNIISRRKSLGFKSAMKFAEFAGLPYPTYRDIEAGLSEGQPETRKIIAGALNCSVADLFLNEIYSSPVRGDTQISGSFSMPVSGAEQIKIAVREALAEGPLPLSFEHPDALKRAHAEIAELRAKMSELEKSNAVAKDDDEARLLKGFRNGNALRQAALRWIAGDKSASYEVAMELAALHDAGVDLGIDPALLSPLIRKISGSF